MAAEKRSRRALLILGLVLAALFLFFGVQGALADGGQILLSHDGLETKLERFPLMRDAARRRGLDLAIYNMTSDANYAATAAPAGGAHP